MINFFYRKHAIETPSYVTLPQLWILNEILPDCSYSNKLYLQLECVFSQITDPFNVTTGTINDNFKKIRNQLSMDGWTEKF